MKLAFGNQTFMPVPRTVCPTYKSLGRKSLGQDLLFWKSLGGYRIPSLSKEPNETVAKY